MKHEPAFVQAEKLHIPKPSFDRIVNDGLTRDQSTSVPGTSRPRDEFPFTITCGQGIFVIPLSASEKPGR